MGSDSVSWRFFGHRSAEHPQDERSNACRIPPLTARSSHWTVKGSLLGGPTACAVGTIPCPQASRQRLRTETGGIARSRVFEHEADMEHFLANICTAEWNQQLDAGRSFAEACAALKVEHANSAEMIDAWFERFDEMMAGPIAGTADILSELREREVPIYALSNWSAETFPFARRRFEFLQGFRAILLSPGVHLPKPDPRIFERFCETFALRPEQMVYIDDAQHNVEVARRLGMHGIRFDDAASLREELVQLGLLASRARIEHVAAWVSNLDRARFL